MNKKIFLTSALITGMTVFAAGTFAATNSGTTTWKNRFRTTTESGQVSGETRSHQGMFMEENLTDAEKTALSSMTQAEKKAFFDKKHAEMEAKMEAREAIIDKLLAWTTLTSDEEAQRQDIIKERAAMKVQRDQMKAQMEKVKTILDKKDAGQTLTSDEQATLDAMPKKMDGKKGGPHGHRMGSMGKSN